MVGSSQHRGGPIFASRWVVSIRAEANIRRIHFTRRTRNRPEGLVIRGDQGHLKEGKVAYEPERTGRVGDRRSDRRA
jgi:hypothetical protein